MNTRTTEFFQNTDITGALTPEQAAQLIELATSGDTGAQPDTSGAPTTATAPDTAANESPAGEPPAAANPVLMAKDGIHTIPYDKLLEARSNAQQWQAQAEAAQQELTALKANAQARVDDGQAPTRTDNLVAAAEAAIEAGADISMFGDFSEEALAAGIKKTVIEEVRREMAPQRKQEQEAATDSHYSAILSAHQDAGSIVQSAELDNWINSRPSYVQPGIRHVLDEGSAEQVIELLNEFKSATGKTQTGAASQKQAAQDAIANAQSPIPASLSDIPGGRADGLSANERMANLDPASMAEAMAGMSPEQIQNYLNRKS